MASTAELGTRKFLVCCICIVLSRCCSGETGRKLDCHDAEGNIIPDGSQFIPDKKDPCQTCQCENGHSIMCTAVSCSPPACNHKAIDGKCCEFICIDRHPSDPQKPGVNNTGGGTRTKDTPSGGITSLGLRLVASTITSFLVLALLLFMIHKLRQRRLLMTVRRLNSSRRRLEEVDHDRYLPDAPPLGLTVPPYQDPPPPYSPPKPPETIAPGEPPPPYEAINNNNNMTTPVRAMHEPLEPPPAYQSHSTSRQSSVPSQTNLNESSQQVSYSSLNSTTCRPTSDLSRWSVSGQPETSLELQNLVEDTRVKEVFSGTPTCERESGINFQQVRDGGSGRSQSSRTNENTCETAVGRDTTQNMINIFGPRCIKKSGSVEIVRQSISPRNSYMEGDSDVDAMSQSLDPALLNRMLNGVHGYPPTSSSQTTSVNTPATLNPPPANTSYNCPERGHRSGASFIPANRIDHDLELRLSNLRFFPRESVESPVSPQSPAGIEAFNKGLRSNSITSDLSCFSVCSETGEPRKSTTVIKNDCQYPEGSSLLSSRVSEVPRFFKGNFTPGECNHYRGDNSVKQDIQNKCANGSTAAVNFLVGKLDNSSSFPTSFTDHSFNNNQGSPQDLNSSWCANEKQMCTPVCTCDSCQPECGCTGPWEKKESFQSLSRPSAAKRSATSCQETGPKVQEGKSGPGRGRKMLKSSAGFGSEKSTSQRAKQPTLVTSFSVGDSSFSISDERYAPEKNYAPNKSQLVDSRNIYKVQGSQTLPAEGSRRVENHGAHQNNRHNNKPGPGRQTHRPTGASRTNRAPLCSDV